ncbi:MAG: hypothetical protein OER87_15195 [Gammaproteobacteria bacterium]|nr:hypothetical protein [Gammaproteobacteria bacterium]
MLKLSAFASEIVSFDDGDVVFQSGGNADLASVIVEDAVDIITDAGPIDSDIPTQNQLIGELNLLNNTPRNTTLVTWSNLRVMGIAGEMLFRMPRENSGIALDVIRMPSGKLVRSDAQLKSLQRRVNREDGA